jgi:hypothetical protein
MAFSLSISVKDFSAGASGWGCGNDYTEGAGDERRCCCVGYGQGAALFL